MGDGGMHLVNGPGYFQHDGRQMDDGDSANCRIAERPYNPQASAESPTGAAQDHAAIPRSPRIRPDLSRSRSPRGQRIGTQIDPAVSGGRSGRACRARRDVTAKVSDCTHSPGRNVVPSPDPLVSAAVAGQLDSRSARSHGVAAFIRHARSFNAAQPALPRNRRQQGAAQSILQSTFILPFR
jgi:hypothetical protein